MAEVKAFEEQFTEWAREQWPDENERRNNAWLLAAIKTHMRWAQGKEVSRADLEAAADEVRGIKIGGGGPPASIDTNLH